MKDVAVLQHSLLRSYVLQGNVCFTLALPPSCPTFQKFLFSLNPDLGNQTSGRNDAYLWEVAKELMVLLCTTWCWGQLLQRPLLYLSSGIFPVSALCWGL